MIPMVWCIIKAFIICSFSIIHKVLFGDLCIGDMPPVKILFTGSGNLLPFIRIVLEPFFQAAQSLIKIIPLALVKTVKFLWLLFLHNTILLKKGEEAILFKTRVLPIVLMMVRLG